MKRARTLHKSYSNLFYDVVVACKELYYKITKLTGKVVIDLCHTYSEQIPVPVRSFVYADEEKTSIEYGYVTAVLRDTGENILIQLQSSNAAELVGIYDMELSKLVELYDQLEGVYKLEKKKAKSVAR